MGLQVVLFQPCMSGEGNPAPLECTQAALPNGSFAVHGLTVDAIPGGPTLLFARARHYDPKLGRWLQRDPKGYVDGPNPYEAFGGNPLANVDPFGESDEPGWARHLGDPRYDLEAKRRLQDPCLPRQDLKIPIDPKSAVVPVLVVGSYLGGPLVGIPVTVAVAGTGAYCSYAERSYQFQELNDQPASPGQLASIVFCDVTQASSVWLILVGDDLFVATDASSEDRVNTGLNLGVALTAGGITGKGIPAIRSGVAVADQAALQGLAKLLPTNEWSQSFVFRQGLEMGARRYAAQTATAAESLAAIQFLADDFALRRFHGDLGPFDIRFSQPTVSHNLSEGGTITDMIEGLRTGELDVSQIPAIRVIEHNGMRWSLDNRRLLAFREAGLQSIPLRFVSLNEPLIGEMFKQRFNPINDGQIIVVTPGASARKPTEGLLRTYGKIR